MNFIRVTLLDKRNVGEVVETVEVPCLVNAEHIIAVFLSPSGSTVIRTGMAMATVEVRESIDEVEDLIHRNLIKGE